jgi:hydroxymethylpyrimidine pyrophosphatase-like HAD family hydrolase
MTNKKILIFDLDDTLTHNCFSDKNINLIQEILSYANSKKWPTYVVTARSLYHNGKKYTKESTLTYGLDPYIVNLLKNGRSVHDTNPRWFYYFDPELFEIFNNIGLDKLGIDPVSIVKFSQILEIKQNHPKIPWKNVYFFDDAKYHLTSFVNACKNKLFDDNYKGICELKFVGGQDHCVFNDYDFSWWNNITTSFGSS